MISSTFNTVKIEVTMQEMPYMRTVIVEPQPVVYNAMIRMICFEEMLQPPPSLLYLRFDIIEGYRREVDPRVVATIP
jgi:hypothetical protein